MCIYIHMYVYAYNCNMDATQSIIWILLKKIIFIILLKFCY